MSDDREDMSLDAELVARLSELDALEPADPCRVERVIKESPSEVTQLVWLRLAGGGETGPYVRKIVRRGAGDGCAWGELLRAQRDGLRTPNLPRVLSCDARHDGLHVLMEHVPGPTLREIAEKTPAPEREQLTAAIVPQLCEALSVLHEELGVPVIHRDVTPSNVICSGLHHDVAVLVDLGISRTWKPKAEADTTHFGTRAYAAPEQYGFGQTDVRSDVYSLGLVAFFCLTGRDSSPADREAGFSSEGVPEAWRQVIAKAAAFDPDDRYGSARDLRQAIETLADTKGGSSNGTRRSVKSVLLRAWRSRNFVILPVAVLLIAASSSCAFDPRYNSNGPLWYNAFGYLVYTNYLIAALAYLAMDKRWLRAHVPRLGDRTLGQDLRLLGVVFVVLTAVLFALSIPTG